MGFKDKFKRMFKSDEITAEIKRSASPQDFRYLENLIHSGDKEIVLTSDIVLGNGENYRYDNGIKVDIDGLTIDGGGHAIDACGDVTIFKCMAKNVTIKNITLKNGYSDSLAAGIVNLGELKVINVSFKSNRAENSEGGAISNSNILYIEDCRFEDNHAYMGGAVSNNGKVIIRNSRFFKNEAGSGSAVYNGDWFIENVGMSIEGSVFSNNSNGIGDMIFNRDYLTLRDCILSDNDCKDKDMIYNMGSLKLIDCEVSRNVSPKVIYNWNSVEINDAVFKDNRSKHLLFNKDDAVRMAISIGKFTDNFAESLIYNEGESCIVSEATFEGNPAPDIVNQTSLTLIKPKMKDEGKRILNNGQIIIKKEPMNLVSLIEGQEGVEIVTVPDNSKFDFGYLDRLIHESESNEIVLDEDICLERYEADFYEGGIELDIDGLVIDGNGRTIDGAGLSRIFHISADDITIKNVTLKNGRSFKNADNFLNNPGGAIRICHHTDATFDNCTFEDNVSGEYGGAIGNSGRLCILNSMLSTNKADSGGAIFNRAELTINNTCLAENSVKRPGNGGAIYTLGKLNVMASRFFKNNAKEGGSVYAGAGEISISESSFESGKSSIRGGAIHLFNGNMLIENTVFDENRGDRGGAVYSHEGKLTIEKSLFKNNDSSTTGGAIHNENGSLSVSATEFDNNNGVNAGKTIFNDYKVHPSKVNIDDCIITDERSDDIYICSK
ncbi:hypothetical protein [Methanobrevibacter sp.]|uniref:hypothetical protein n=1 Tax=Methanobrevibacter sp. TaxID=66852 RepID=UPI002E773252|nr:hypothetical protein [Methanobrevibacter sp.]MEE1336154.1 hypothetical protein [Methanobrevibacter sp.]